MIEVRQRKGSDMKLLERLRAVLGGKGADRLPEFADIQLADRPRPSAAQMVALLRDELLPPYGTGGFPDLSGYDEIDIVRVWDYGPIGMPGRAWLHPKFRLVVVVLEDEVEPIFVVPDFTKSQTNNIRWFPLEGQMEKHCIPAEWTGKGTSFNRQIIGLTRYTEHCAIRITAQTAKPKDSIQSLIIRVTAKPLKEGDDVS